MWFLRQVKNAGRHVAVAVAMMTCYGLPLSADTLVVKSAVAPDKLFDPSLVSVSVSAGEFPSIGADLLLRAEPKDLFAFAAFPSEADTLNLLAERQDDYSESGTAGVRRFIVLTILFGGLLRFLTSSAFYAWAAEVFDPLDGY